MYHVMDMYRDKYFMVSYMCGYSANQSPQVIKIINDHNDPHYYDEDDDDEDYDDDDDDGDDYDDDDFDEDDFWANVTCTLGFP